MLVSAIIDPKAFDRSAFDTPGYLQNAELLFKRIAMKNGLLVTDTRGLLATALKDALEALPTRDSQVLLPCLAEVLKNRRVELESVLQPSASRADFLAALGALQTCACADGIVIRSAPANPSAANPSLVPVDDFSRSEFEHRAEGLERVEPLDRLPRSEVEDLLVRIVRHTAWLRFYDAQIGKSRSDCDRFYRGLAYILELWTKHGVHASLPRSQVAIYTVAPSTALPERWREIEVSILAPLRALHPNVSICVKRDPDRVFHARYLEVETAAIQFDRGFDLFDRNGSFKANILMRQDHLKWTHLIRCRSLPAAAVGGNREFSAAAGTAGTRSRSGSTSSRDRYEFICDGATWHIVFGGSSQRTVNSTVGMHYIAHLLSHPGEPIAAVALSELHPKKRGASEPKYRDVDGSLTVRSGAAALGRSERVSDLPARQAYGPALAEVNEELAEAEERCDLERVARLRDARHALVEASSRRFTGEKKRRDDAVRRSIQTALVAIKDSHREAWDHLTRTLKCGSTCLYHPSTPIKWST